MKYYIYTVLLLLLTASCSDDVQKWECNGRNGNLPHPLSVRRSSVRMKRFTLNFSGKKMRSIWKKDRKVEFSGIVRK